MSAPTYIYIRLKFNDSRKSIHIRQIFTYVILNIVLKCFFSAARANYACFSIIDYENKH